MGKNTTRVEGFKEARETLQELSRTVQRNVGKRALVVPANMVAAAISANAPISNDPHDKTPGSLKDSPRVVPEKGKRGGSQLAVVVEDPAAVPNEFGLSGKDFPAKPFARPAVDRIKGATLIAFGAALKPEIDAAAKRAAKKAK